MGLVSSAFTSFSNDERHRSIITDVWYLLLLHHSQTDYAFGYVEGLFGIFCFYIILKLSQLRNITGTCLVSSAFTSFSNELKEWFLDKIRLVPFAFTSFSNLKLVFLLIQLVWYLLLLHHSQTIRRFYCYRIVVCSFCFYIILKLTASNSTTYRSLVASAFTSFSNKGSRFRSHLQVW